MSKRPFFQVTTSGVETVPSLPSSSARTNYEKKETSDIFSELVDSPLKDKPMAAFIHLHSQAVDIFIRAVAKGIGMKPEELVFDQYQPFLKLLEHWAKNSRKSKNIPKTKIRLGKRILIGQGSEEEEESESTKMEGSTEVEVPKKTNMLGPEQFKALFVQYREDQSDDNIYTDDMIFLNWLRYFYEKHNYPNRTDNEIIAQMGAMVVPFNLFTLYKTDGAAEQRFDFGEMFLGRGLRAVSEIERYSNTGQTMKTPVASSTPKRPKNEISKATLELIEHLLEEAPESVHASNLVAEYEYSILPERYSKFFFGKELVYGIGQAMQRLREKYNFTRTNNELFTEFIREEEWTALFVTLVVGVIDLQTKIHSAISPQAMIQNLENRITLTVNKFASFKRFNRQPTTLARKFNF